MNILKKLIFAPIFLIVFSLLIYHLTPFLDSYDLIFSLSLTTFIQLIIVCLLISLSSFLFILFATLAFDFKITVPIIIISSVISLLFVPPALALILMVAVFISLLLTYLSLDSTLKSYLDFQPVKLLGPAVRHLSGFLILSFCLVYFLSTSTLISQKGFQIPDSLIDTALKMSPVNMPTKQNPDLLKQYGLDPQEILQTPVETTNNLIKQTVKDQIQGFIKPYINFIPAILAVLLFFTLQSLVSIINLLVYPLLWLIFLILEKTGFIKFEVTQRPVRKMVV